MNGAPAAPVLMLQGTASGVGKSLLTAAFCRILARRGLRVAPFKAQNMSNNAAVTVEGGEIGRAQALQARAAGVAPEVRMNPVLLKPMADTRSEVVLLGRGRPELTDLPWRERRRHLWPSVSHALDALRREFQVVVVEGAGSPAEVNLRSTDVVNMSVAEHADAVVLLVSDIDRGGAFASLFGTWALLENADRERIKGFLLNRFRGDAGLLAPAPEVLERRTGVPVVGVVPWIRHLLPEEDGPPPLQASPDDGALPHGTPADTEASGRTPTPVVVGVVAFPHFSNADDLDPLRAEPQVRLRSVRRVQDLFGVDALILPGSRNTLADLAWLFETGIADGVRGLGRSGTPILGICGGYQMLGSQVLDPLGVEGGGAREGLGLLPVETVLSQRKETRLTLARIRAGDHLFNDLEGAEVEGYEIHHGRSVAKQAAIPWIEAEAGPLGHARGPVWGGYLHGILESEQLRLAWLRALGVERAAGGSWGTRLEAEIDRLADEVEANVDLERIIGWLGLGGNS